MQKRLSLRASSAQARPLPVPETKNEASNVPKECEECKRKEKVIDQLYDGIPTSKIDELTAEQCATLSTHHLDYGTLEYRICEFEI